MPISKEQAQTRARQLYDDLKLMVARDPEQEVQGIALPVLDACLSAFRDAAVDDPILATMRIGIG